MSNNTYTINKGVDKPIEFKGLKAQYAVYLGIGLLGLLLGFVVLYISGVPPLICPGIVAVIGGVFFQQLYGISKRYGQYGLMKKRAARRIPKFIKSSSRRVFQLKNQ